MADILCFLSCLGSLYTYWKSIQCVSIALKLTQTVEDRILPQEEPQSAPLNINEEFEIGFENSSKISSVNRTGWLRLWMLIFVTLQRLIMFIIFVVFSFPKVVMLLCVLSL